MINYFKAAERLLRERGNLEQALKNLEHRREWIIRRGGPSEIMAADPARPHVSTSASADTIAECLDLVMVGKEITTTRETIELIDRVLGQLSDDDAKLLKAWYITGETKEQIAERFSYGSRTSIYDLRNKAISRVAILYFGAGALPST